MPKDGAISGWSAAGQSDWRIACELLAAGQYERVAQLLGEAQTAHENVGDVGLAQMLAAARGICLACNQVRTEGEWHRQAQQEAGQREGELRQQLLAILDLVNGRVPMAQPSLSEPGAPPPSRRPGLKQRIRGLLGRRPGTPPTRPEAMLSTHEMPASPSPEPVEMSAGALPDKQSAEALSSMVVYCLGLFRVYQNDQLITDWDSLKARSVFKYLLTHRGTPIGKEILMDIFWPEADPKAARRNLHQAIYSLRQTLRGEQQDFQHIRFEDDCYSLNPEMSIWIDSEEFEKHIQAGRRLEAAGRREEAITEYGVAEGLYRGDFLEEDLYEEWPLGQRDHARNTYLEILGRLSEYYVGRSEYTAAIALCQKVLARDNCDEEAHRRLIHCYLALGQPHLAVRQYQACVEALKQELDLTPSEETVALYRRIIATTYKR